MKLAREELERYPRQTILPYVGIAGQERLKVARVLLVGLGGLGCPAAQYLAAAGVGTIGLVDPDLVEVHNLHRQVLYHAADVGRPKVTVAAERLRAQNPFLQAEACHSEFLPHMVEGFDVVLDGTDRFSARYAINEACVRARVPNVHAAVFGLQGQLSVFDVSKGPCYRCVFPKPPAEGSAPTCAEAGVLGMVPGVLGTMQAIEALKLLLGFGEPLIGRMLLLDLECGSSRTLRSDLDPLCPTCATVKRTPMILQKPASIPEISAIDLKQELDSERALVLLDVREAEEIGISSLQGIVHIPIQDIPARIDELDPSSEIVVICRSGNRSAQVTQYLLAVGFEHVRNLTGGMNEWAKEVDPRLPRY